MKEAIVFPTPEEDEIPMWTLARAMNCGWMFRIPVYDRKGNGYIYDSDYITADEAQKEVETQRRTDARQDVLEENITAKRKGAGRRSLLRGSGGGIGFYNEYNR